MRETKKLIWYAVYLTIWVPSTAGLVFVYTNFTFPYLLVDLPVLSYIQSLGVCMIVIVVAPRDIVEPKIISASREFF